MDVLFVTHANPAHLYLQVPLAWALRTAGHEVRVAGQPEVVGEIVRAGLSAVPVGRPPEPVDPAIPDPAIPDPGPEAGSPRQPAPGQPAPQQPLPRQPMPRQGDYARADPLAELSAVTWNGYTMFSPEPMIEDLVRYARAWRPDLVIWDAITFAGPVAARACGAAHARLLFSVDGISQLRNGIRDSGAGGDPLRDWLEPVLARYGCRYGDDVVLGQRTIDPMPPWQWRPTGPEPVPLRHVPYHGGAEVSQWLTRPPARPRVFLTLGGAHPGSEASVAPLLQAVDGLDVEVLAVLDERQRTAAPAIPGNVRLLDRTPPLEAVLPTCAAVVHDGDDPGLFLAAVDAGVPQLLVPTDFWCLRWWGPVAQANALADNGAGVFVGTSDQLTAAALRGDLVRVLQDPSFRKNAERLGADRRAVPGVRSVVTALEELAAAGR